MLTATTVIVMAEEFEQLPLSLQKFSSMLVHNRNSRNIFICGVIILMSASISLSLYECTNRNSQMPVEPDALQNDDYRNYDRPIFISNVNIFENEVPLSVDNKKMYNGVDDLPPNRKEIIFNLFLTATVHHNITLNGVKISDVLEKDCEMNCDEQKIKEIIRKYVEMLKMSNDTKTSVESDYYDKVYDNSLDGNEGNCSMNLSDCSSKIHSIIKRNANSKTYNSTETITTTTEYNFSNKSTCEHPEYIVFMWVLCLIALATALKLYYLIKTCLAVILLTVYTVLITQTGVFENDSIESR